jgi:hypothetical protein
MLWKQSWPSTRDGPRELQSKDEQQAVRTEQTVSEMVVESLGRQARVLSEGSGRPFEEALVEVLKTPAGYLLAELADGAHRREKAAKWQAGLLKDREARRPAHLRSSENGHENGEEAYPWLASYMEQVEGTDAQEEYHALLRAKFSYRER